MEVILREDVEKLGNRGQVVKVAPGFARNFLLPKKLAVAATESNKKIVEQERQAHLRKEAKFKGEAEDLAKLRARKLVPWERPHDRFEKRDRLHLSLVLHGVVESEPGKWTLFRFTWPKMQGQEA